MTALDASQDANEPKDHPQPHLFTITVNGKPVSIAGPKTTGRLIKEAAIVAGLPIQLDFILSEELPNRKTRLVRDDDKVSIHEGSAFVALANDDNS
jgi:hypothetical protein